MVLGLDVAAYAYASCSVKTATDVLRLDAMLSR
ncbi:hypothetical protein RHECNPAF_387007 [Rhizobium etli CNPAF512]|nr:hypothetical protein RHECNPAF_387007 [Rhizobium etli CNPAF512]